MKTENKLKFGHRVIAWDNDKSKSVKGRYVYFSNGYYEILEDDRNETEGFKNCELDLKATEFVIGDLVIANGIKHTYIGKHPNGDHVIHDDLKGMLMCQKCRYPQPPKQFIFTSDMTRSQITSMVDEMLKSWGK